MDKVHAFRAGVWRGPAVIGAVVFVLTFVWVAHSRGLLSSNDGSHVALARAFAHGRTHIDPDEALTLQVDKAHYGGHDRSDRAPGTAVLAALPLRVAEAFDPTMVRRSRARGRLVLPPASDPYILTYARRTPKSPPLVARIATGTAASLFAVVMGLVGLWGLERTLHRLGVETKARVVTVLTMGMCTTWGMYATACFSHVVAAAAIAWYLRGLVELRDRDAHPCAPPVWLALGTGAVGAHAVASDYALVLAVVPLAFALVRPRHYGLVAAGALPVAGFLAVYHWQAFGHPLSTGYAHHVNFEFTHSHATTFDGPILSGAWTLFGAGRGAGLLALCPIAWIGAAGFGLAQDPRGRGWRLRLTLPWVPWLLALCMHHTPWGGVSGDHRYLVPLFPLLGVGLAFAWQRLLPRPGLAVALAIVALVSAWLGWSHFLGWHDAPWFGLWGFGLVIATLSAGVSAGAAWLVTRRREPALPP